MKREVDLHVSALGYNLVTKWEHDFCNENNSNQSLSKFVEGLDIQDRLNPRASFFFKGRTNATKLDYKATGDKNSIL